MKQALKQLLGRLGYRVEGTRYTPRHLFRPECVRRLQFDDVICRYMFEHGQACSFIQVGAYDGIAAGPLRRYIERCGWRGVMLSRNPGRQRNCANYTRTTPTFILSRQLSIANE